MFQTGQIVQCHRAVFPQHQKLVGCVGEIRDVLTGTLGGLLLMCDYVVFFPAYPEGMCPYCKEHHNPLEFAMLELELKPIDDPDKGEEIDENEELPEELRA